MPTVKLQFRRDTTANWTLNNPILADGELVIDTTLNQFKIGNGSSHWIDLPYGGLHGSKGPRGPLGLPIAGDTGPAGPQGVTGPRGTQGLG